MSIESTIQKRLEFPFLDLDSRSEIVKYNPSMYNSRGQCVVDDWTSCADIGKSFNGQTFTVKDYLYAENCYVETILDIMLCTGCKQVTLFSFSPIYPIEIPFGMNEQIKESSLIIINNIGEIASGKRYTPSCATDILRLCFRELVDCFFINLSKGLQFDVGYDYYLHLYSRVDYQVLSSIVTRHGLYLNPRLVL